MASSLKLLNVSLTQEILRQHFSEKGNICLRLTERPSINNINYIIVDMRGWGLELIAVLHWEGGGSDQLITVVHRAVQQMITVN